MTSVNDSAARWRRVSRSRPCPICGKPDWCVVTEDGSAAICPRVPEGSQGSIRDAGYLHILRTFSARTRSVPVRVTRTDAFPDLSAYAQRCRTAVNPASLHRLAQGLGVTTSSLLALGIGWDGRAWTFPMSDARGRVRGIRLRNDKGQKWAVKGGREGLFIPSTVRSVGDSILFVCEGPTDTAALLDLGLRAVGRPSAMGGTRLLVELARALRPPQVVIVADTDGVGQRGAEALSGVLVTAVPDVRVIRPTAGMKDARAWKNAGATAADINQAIEQARSRRLTVRVQMVTKQNG